MSCRLCKKTEGAGFPFQIEIFAFTKHTVGPSLAAGPLQNSVKVRIASSTPSFHLQPAPVKILEAKLPSDLLGPWLRTLSP